MLLNLSQIQGAEGSFCKNGKLTDYRAYFLDYNEFDDEYLVDAKEEYVAYSNYIVVYKIRGKGEYGRSVDHVVISKKGSKRKTAIFNEKILQDGEFTKIKIEGNILSFSITGRNEEILTECYFKVVFHDDIGLIFINSIGIEMNY